MILVLLGAIASKFKLLDDRINRGMSEVLIHIVTPCLIISNLQVESSADNIKGILIVFGITSLIYIVSIIISSILFRKSEKYDYRVLRFMSTYANCGYMGFPLVQGILGDKGAFYVVAVIAVFNLFTFTHGVILMKKSDEKFTLKGLISPALIAVLLGMIFLVFRIHLPNILKSPLSMMASLNTPLAMLVAGYNIDKTKLKHIKNIPRIIEVLIYKLIFIPIIVTLIMSVVTLPSLIKLVIIITSACPSATVGVIFSVKYDRDSKFASTIFALSTVLIVVTLPLIILIANLLHITI